MRNLLKIFTFFFVVSILPGCSAEIISKADAEKYLVLFHQKYNEKEFSWLYQDFSPGFRAEAKENDFVQVLGKVRQILGKAESYELIDSWDAKKISGENLKVYRFKTKYENGFGVEILQFDFDQSTKKSKLFRYDINSDEIAKAMLLK